MTATDSRLTTLEHAFQAFADPTRLRILGVLAAGEVCVSNIHECLGIPQPTASRHLAYLRKKGLVNTRNDGLWVYYTLAPLEDAVMRVLMAAVTHCLCHCEVVTKDRRRLEAATGCCTPGVARANLECCAPSSGAPKSGRGVRAGRVPRAAR